MSQVVKKGGKEGDNFAKSSKYVIDRGGNVPKHC